MAVQQAHSVGQFENTSRLLRVNNVVRRLGLARPDGPTPREHQPASGN